MSESVEVLRSRLRGLSAALRELDEQRRALRDEQVAQLQLAMQHRATIRDATTASGLSRGYLHRIGMHEDRGADSDDAARDAALERARDCRRQLDELDDGTQLRLQRDVLIRTLHDALLPAGQKHSRQQRADVSAAIATDAGLTGERVRLILRDALPAEAVATEPERTAPIDALRQAILDGRPGIPTSWTHRGVEVTVYGQSRQNMDAPTPWAVITVAGRIRAFTSWEQIIAAVEESVVPSSAMAGEAIEALRKAHQAPPVNDAVAAARRIAAENAEALRRLA